MTLHDRVAQVTRGVAAVQRGEAERQLIQAITARASRAKTSSDKLTKALIFARRLRVQIGPLDDVQKPSAALAQKPRVLQQRLDKDPLEQVMSDQEWPNALFTPLEAYLEKLNTGLLGAWQSAVDVKVPKVDAMFLQLERLGYAVEVAKARSAMKVVQTLRTSLPSTDTAMDEIDKNLAIVGTALATLTAVPAPVRGFLAGVAATTVSLVDYDELDQSSRDWLKKSDILQRIRLNLT